MVSKNENISGHQMPDVQKCKHFSTPNVWCLKMKTFLDTEHSVSKNTK